VGRDRGPALPLLQPNGAARPLSPLGQAALDYAARGWRVFPLLPGGKAPHPGLPRMPPGTGGHRLATTDPATIGAWWRRWPDANVGWALDESGYMAVDADVYKPECEWHSFIQGRDPPPTLEQSTPNGGLHYVFTAEPGERFAGELCRHVDIIARGYIVAAPSVVGGVPYVWQTDDEPAPCPDWVPRRAAGPNGSAANGSAHKGNAERVEALLRGVAVHDNSRDLAASLIVRGVPPETVGDITAGAILAGTEPGQRRDERLARVAYHISSAQAKFGPGGADGAPIASTPWRRQDLATMPPREMLYGRLLQRGKVTLTAAASGLGKSAMAGAAEALAMATGRKLLHDAVPAPLRVWVWNLEEDQDELNRRLEAACAHFGIEGEIDSLFVDNGFAMPCKMARQERSGAVIIRPVTDAVVAEIQRRQIDVLVIDPFISTHSVNENDNAAVDAVAKEWARVAHDGRCAVHMVHHTYKLRGFEATVDAARGASSLIAAVRFARVLNEMTAREAEDYGLTDHWRYFRANDGKANYVPRADAAQWFTHASVVLPNGDNVGVVTPFRPPSATAGVTVHHLADVVRLAGERAGPERYREAPQSPGWIGHMVAEVIGADLEMPADKRRVKAALAMWLGSGVLRTVEGRDEERKTRMFVVPGEPNRFDPDDIDVGTTHTCE
jgi:hypothetical protein